MHKKVYLSVSSCILAGLFLSGCSQQQIHSSSSVSSGGPGGAVIDGSGNPIKDGYGGIVRSTYAASSSVSAPDIQTAPMVRPSVMDSQVQHIVVPEPVYEPVIVAPKRIHKPKVHHHNVQPKQTRHYMAKPVQRMAKPIQRRSVSYTGKRSGMPPAVPNQCYAKVKTGPKFKNIVKRVQVSPAVNKRVLVRGPQYAYTSKRVQVRPATHSYRFVPAQYRNVSKRVLVKPAHYAWQKGKRGPVTRIDHMTGEILCRVKVPAVYRTVVQKVLARPAQRIKKHIPAVYRTVKQKKLASPAQYRNVHQPARFVNKTYRVQSGGAGYRWQPIDC